MGSDSMLPTPSLMRFGTGVQKVLGVIHRQLRDLIQPILYFQSKDSKLKMTFCTQKKKQKTNETQKPGL
jgi:hypothetical protein